MPEKKKIPHIVDVTASYRRSVIVLAEDTATSEQLAETLCSNGIIAFTNDDSAGCEAVCGGVASPMDFRYYSGVFSNDGKLPISAHGYLVTSAIRLINEYLRDTFGAETSKVDVEHLDDIPLASTDYEEVDERVPVSSGYNVSVKADLLHCQIRTYINDILVDIRKFRNLEVFCNEELAHLNFAELICLGRSDWVAYLGATVQKDERKAEFYRGKQVQWLKENYPSGTRVQLVKMVADSNPVDPGTLGTIYQVDGAGTFNMLWDNGRSLSLIPGIDKFVVV